MAQSIFIALPKKHGAVDCEQHHTISLMRHVTKIASWSLWNWKKERGLRIGGQNITNLCYAHGTVLLAESQEDLQGLLDVVVEEKERKGLSINCKKTESMVISKKKEAPTCNLQVKDKIIKQVFAFNYLGSTVTEGSRGPFHRTCHQ